MAWAKPEYSRREVNRAGLALINPLRSKEDLSEPLNVINNWRASHITPLNTFQKRLRRKAKEIDSNSLVVQRIKRLSSIRYKLGRIRGLNLAQIQDIGGCRAIVSNMSELNNLIDTYTNQSRGIKHVLFSVDDYVNDTPKDDGYRSIHLVYKYRSDKNTAYDNLKIEIQFRTHLQHSWATAVETIDAFTGQALKLGNGDPVWGRFFAVSSSIVALEEKCPIIPNTSSKYHELQAELIELEEELNVITKLRAFTTTLQHAPHLVHEQGSYFLLSLDTAENRIDVQVFSHRKSIEASRAYIELEININKGEDVVLVSADSLDALKLAYPNYYADTSRFIRFIESAMMPNRQLTLFD